jgi:hypothetical protein
MANLSQFRFRIVTTDSVGAYTVSRAASQADALATLQSQLTRWETALPLHGPSVSPRWFD